MNLFDRFFRRKPEIDVESIKEAARQEGRKEAVKEIAKEIVERLTPVGPLTPSPMSQTFNAKPSKGIYGLDTPITFTTPQPPKKHPGSPVTVDTLRLLADTYDIARDCINHLKREVAATPFKVVARNEKDKSTRTQARCDAAMKLFGRTGPVGLSGGYYSHFENKILEDVLVIGVSCVYHQRNALGGWLSCDAIDAATIRPMLDPYGWPPEGETADAYEQWIYGVQIARFSRLDLDYDGIYLRSYNPYPVSPLEWLINVVNGALRADMWNLTWLTDGNTPDQILGLPPEWTVEMVMQFSQFWESLMTGNTSGRQKTRFLPGGTKSVMAASRKDQDFQEYELWLMRRTCAIFGVQPASIGFAGEQYKVTQENSMEATTQFGTGPLLAYRKAKLDDILARAGFDDLHVVDANGNQESEAEIATMCSTSIASGQMTPNEARQRRGLEPIEGGDTLFVSSTLVPLEQALLPPEPPPAPGETDPDKDPTKTRIERKKKSLMDSLNALRAAMIDPADEAAVAVREVWESTDSAIREAWESLVDRIEAALADGQVVNEAWLLRESRYRSLLTTISDQSGKVAPKAAKWVHEGQQTVTEAAIDGQLSLFDKMAGRKPEGVDIEWNRPPVEAINNLIGFAGDGSPLADLFDEIGPGMAEHATKLLAVALADGIGPRQAGIDFDTVFNVGFARAQTIARTEMLRAAREASRQTYQANRDALEGWIWFSARSLTTCAACWAMHGTLHDVSETLDGHPNCCCAMVPRTKSWAEITGDDSLEDTRPEIETGESLFEGLPPAQQKEVLGVTLFEAYQNGAVKLADCVTQADNARWGTMRRPATITEATIHAGVRG